MLPIDLDQIELKPLEDQQVIEQKVTKKSSYNLVFNKAGILAGIIKIPKKEEEKTLRYDQLPRTSEDEKKIEDLISSLGIHGKVTLLLHHEKRLRQIGEELRYLHPFKFTGYIFSKPHLKTYMKEVLSDYFKRTNFVQDFSQTMDIYDFTDKLNLYIKDFAKEVNIEPSKIKPFIDKKDWEGFLHFLTNE